MAKLIINVEKLTVGYVVSIQARPSKQDPMAQKMEAYACRSRSEVTETLQMIGEKWEEDQ